MLYGSVNSMLFAQVGPMGVVMKNNAERQGCRNVADRFISVLIEK